MKLTLYRIEVSYMGMHMKLHPRVPISTAIGEDVFTDRICACTSVYGCIVSTEVHTGLIGAIPLYVYETCIDTEKCNVYQPSYEDVFDAFITGEYWIKDPVTFKFKGKYILSPHVDIGSDEYIRYKFVKSEQSDIPNKDSYMTVYGDPFCFSFIAMKPPALRKRDGDNET